MKAFIDKLRLKVVKKWYSLPRFRPVFNIGIKKHKRDDREFDWYLDRRQYGVDERATWDLSGAAVAWFLPRLKMYKLCTPFYPNNLDSMEEWHALIDDMLFFLEYKKVYGWQRRGDDVEKHTVDESRARRGQVLLFQYFWSFGW